MRMLLLSVTLLMLLAPAAVAQEPAVKDVLISAVPDPYKLSPESEGVTGPLDAAKAERLGVSTEDLEEEEEDALADAYIRFWFHPNQTDSIIALGMKGANENVAAGMLNGATQRSVEKDLAEFDVDIPDGRGFTEPTTDANGNAAEIHTVVFRRGPYMFTLGVSGQGDAARDLVRTLAREQFDRTPEGETTAELRDPAYEFGTWLGRTAVLVAVVVAVVVLIGRSRRNVTGAEQADPSSRQVS